MKFNLKNKNVLYFNICLILISLISSTNKPYVYAGGGDEKNRSLTSLDSSRALAKLASDLAAIVKLPNEVKNGTVGIFVKSLITGKELYSLNPEKALTPASNTKLVTAYTALNELGTNYDVKTLALALQKPISGIISGNLFLKGFGDPYFNVNDIEDIVDDLIKSGVKQINGDIIGDGSFYDNKSKRIQYSGDADVVEDLPPIYALSIEKNYFTVIVSSLSIPGLPCNVQTYPRSSGFSIINDAVSNGYVKPIVQQKESSHRRVSNFAKQSRNNFKKNWKRHSEVLKSKGSIRFGDELIYFRRKPHSYNKAKVSDNLNNKNGISVVITNDSTGKVLIKVSGKLAVGRRVSYRYEAKNPAAIAAGILFDKLILSGIKINGIVKTGNSPSQYKVLAGVERPLNDMLKFVLKNSNNFLAENVFKIVGGYNGGIFETAHSTIDATNKNLIQDKIPMKGTVINDGSGLSRNNRIPAQTLVGILSSSYRDKKIFKTLYPLMAIAGVDGTVRRRMRGTLAQGNVHAKTGTLNNVSSLSGYVQTKDGEMLAFAFIMNGKGSNGSYHVVQDRLAVRLATFSYKEDPSLIFDYNPIDSANNNENN